MSLRFLFAVVIILYLSWICWKGRWFTGCCGALVTMGFLEHPDIPKSLFGIPGINLWNFLMGNVVICWLRFRKHEGRSWDMPKFLQRSIIIFCVVMFVSFVRAMMHADKVVEETPLAVFCAYFINCFKWVLPLVILYDGIGSREQCRQALCAAMIFYFLISLQVIRQMPLSSLRENSSEFRAKSSRLLQNNVGYNRDNLSTMLAGASWAAFALASAFTSRLLKGGLFACGAIILLAQALTAGKTGYGSWLVVGMILCLVRWRKLLVLLPAACFVILACSPSIRGALFQGFGGNSGQIVQQNDMGEITSGRTVIWPAVIDQIWKSPLFGYGRDGFHSSGVADYTAYVLDDPFPHPHNAYLEWMLDNGILGLLLIIPFYAFVVINSVKLFRQKNGLVSAAGGVTLSLVCGELVGAMGAQTFYPRESTVVMWATIGVMTRVLVEMQADREEPFSAPVLHLDDPDEGFDGEPAAA